jgi:pyruvate,water dikinase
MSYPRIIQFHDIQPEDDVGGKANGLARMTEMDLYVPPGFIVVDAKPGEYPAKLEKAYLALGGGKVAVRSSAIGEDSANASFAGQYETILNVEGIEQLQKAIDKCLESVNTARAGADRADQTDLGKIPMAIVVQEMVEAKCAGVLFTVDPVSNNQEHIVVDAVAGTGEKLVSGEVTPDHYVFDRKKGKLAAKELAGKRSVLTPDIFKQLIKDATAAEKIAGEPLDMEWAVDPDGDVCWLQARPITTLASDLNEMDTTPPSMDDVYTRCNISEALPGPVCPLTLSTTGRALEIGSQRLYQDFGMLTEDQDNWLFMSSYYGHMFLNMTSMAWTSKQVLGTSTHDLAMAICGRDIPELEDHHEVPPLSKRLPRILKYINTLRGGNKARQKLQDIVDSLEMPQQNTVLEHWMMINAKLELLYQAHHAHLVSSLASGMYGPMILGIIAKGEEPNEEHHTITASLLAGAEDVESADIANGAAAIVQQLLEQDSALIRFGETSAPEGYSYLNSGDAGEAQKLFHHYLIRHGHRSISEMDIRTKEWASNPMPLIESLQASYRGMRNFKQKEQDPELKRQEHLSMLNQQNFLVKRLVKMAHNGIRGREQSKSRLIKVTQIFKAAYRQLGQMVVAEGLLPENDLLYFFTHQELEEVLRKQDPEAAKIAQMRRKAYEAQEHLVFQDVFQGKPEPVKPKVLNDETTVKGKPVSRGKVTGRAKIARSVEEALKLEPGDILIAPITDVAWTPYFNLIGGLVTDIGSSVSHGAVVAREYGLPAIVKTDFATQVFQDDEVVVLDANEGYVRRATQQEVKIFMKAEAGKMINA